MKKNPFANQEWLSIRNFSSLVFCGFGKCSASISYMPVKVNPGIANSLFKE